MPHKVVVSLRQEHSMVGLPAPVSVRSTTSTSTSTSIDAVTNFCTPVAKQLSSNVHCQQPADCLLDQALC
jgi:hypothetical protein